MGVVGIPHWGRATGAWDGFALAEGARLRRAVQVGSRLDRDDATVVLAWSSASCTGPWWCRQNVPHGLALHKGAGPLASVAPLFGSQCFQVDDGNPSYHGMVTDQPPLPDNTTRTQHTTTPQAHPRTPTRPSCGTCACLSTLSLSPRAFFPPGPRPRPRPTHVLKTIEETCALPCLVTVLPLPSLLHQCPPQKSRACVARPARGTWLAWSTWWASTRPP